MNAHAMLLGANEDEIALPDMDDRLNHRGDEGSEEDTLESFADIDYDVFAQEHNGLKEKERTMQDNSPDLTGKQFGELTVLRKLENTKHGSSQWLCRCACGADYVVQGSLLLTGRRTRCSGKTHQKNYAYSNITGQRFGRLVAMFPSKRYDKSGSVIWRCRCDCGNEIDVSYKNLLYTNQKSCGCQKREHDQKLKTYLTHVAGTSVDMLKSKKSQQITLPGTRVCI